MDDSRKTKAQLMTELRELRQRVAVLEAAPPTAAERDSAADRHALEDELLREASDLAKVGGWEFDALTLKGTWTAGVARIHDLDPAQETNVELGVSFYSVESRAKIEQGGLLVESVGGRTVFAITIPDQPVRLDAARGGLRRPA